MVSCWLSVCPSIHPSVVHPSIILFPYDNLSKCQLIFTKLGVCSDVVEIWFGNTNGRISSIFGSYLPATHPHFCFQMITWVTWVNVSGFSPNLGCALILWRSGLHTCHNLSWSICETWEKFKWDFKKFCEIFSRRCILSYEVIFEI